MRRFYESKTITDLYIKYRPGITEDVVKEILDYLGKRRNLPETENYFKKLIDVGCGSGQSTMHFAPYFELVEGIDISPNQILEAKKQNKFDNVFYCEGAAEKLSADDNSVDLIVSNAAAHWFDLPKFFQEARRVLKTDGCLAVMCSSLYRFEPEMLPNGNEVEMGAIGSKMLVEYIRKGVYDTEAYGKSFNKYLDIFEAIPSQKKKYTDKVKFYRKLTLENIVGYLKSMDSLQNHLDFKINELQCAGVKITDDVIKSVDLGEEFRRELKALWKVEHLSDQEVKINVEADMWISLACNLHV